MEKRGKKNNNKKLGLNRNWKLKKCTKLPCETSSGSISLKFLFAEDFLGGTNETKTISRDNDSRFFSDSHRCSCLLLFLLGLFKFLVKLVDGLLGDLKVTLERKDGLLEKVLRRERREKKERRKKSKPSSRGLSCRTQDELGSVSQSMKKK